MTFEKFRSISGKAPSNRLLDPGAADPIRVQAFRLLATCLSLSLLGTAGAWAKAPAKPPAKTAAKTKPQPQATSVSQNSGTPRVDSAAVHRFYLDGDFEPAITMLEDNLKETRQYRHEDSVFIFKHLGVMYAAQYETREKGKYYMHKLLMVEPSAKIMDMYASDMIYMIFKNIQEEFEQNRAVISNSRRSSNQADSMPKPNPSEVAAGPAPRPLASGEEAQSSGSRKWIWAGAAVATVAAGVGAYYLLTQQPQVTLKEKDVAF